MASNQSTDSFYLDLPSERDFNSLAEARCYTQAPSDWRLILTDIRGSTRAIREGRYKEVNTLGAASIAAVKSAMAGLSFPFVFGGDGATLLLPESRSTRALSVLAGLRRLASERFGLEMRVGSISIAELEKTGAPVEVAKYQISDQCEISALRGRGLEIAEQKIKAPNSPHEHKEHDFESPDLAALSCRWKPFQTRHGKILAIIIEARTDSGRDPALTYQRVFKKLSGLFPDGVDQANPAESGLRGYRKLQENLRAEVRYQFSAFSLAFLRRAIETLIATVLFQGPFRLPMIRNYMKDTARHCDFRKIDSSFRAVLDCTMQQSRSITEMLTEEYRSGTLYFGIHESEESLMTCLVEGLGSGEHLHFIDAAGGGYAIASARLKTQKTESPGRNSPGTFQI
jgi:hypothetical protein